MAGSSEDSWDPWTYDDACTYVADRAMDLVSVLDPERDERVVDLGCGTGRLTTEIAGAGATVVGVDRSREMLDRARDAHPDLRFVRADAEALPFDGTFDAVFSNATVHWIQDQDAALESIRRSLVPGGRFVAEFGGHGNIRTITDAIEATLSERGYGGEHPWYFPTPGEYASRLEGHGFEVRYLRLFDRPTPLSGGEDGLATWLEVFASGLFAPLSPEERDDVVAAIEDRLREDLFEEGEWIADYRRLRVVAVRE